MQSTTVTTAERLVVDGPFGVPAAIAIGLILALLFAWLLRRESHVLGPRHVVIFWCLRTLAISVVLWMLLAPMKILVETSTTRRAIVFATDVSGSMQTVDPAGSSDDFRWALVRGNEPTFSSTREADQVVAALGVALQKLKEAHAAVQQHRQEKQVLDSLAAAHEAVERAQEHIRRLAEASPERRLSDKCQSLVNRTTKLLNGAEIQAFGQNVTAIRKNRAPTQKGWREGLPDLEHQISLIKTVAQELAWATADSEGKQFAGENPELLASIQNASRLRRVSNFTKSLQQGSLSDLIDKADVRYGSFDREMYWLSGPATEGASSASTRSDSQEPIVTMGTDLCSVFTALQQEAVQQPLAAVFLLSDVAHNQPGEKNPRDVAGALTDTPIYVVPIGNTQHVRDVQLRSVFAPTVAMRNDDIVIEASLQAFHCEGEVCIVQLMQDGKAIDQREIMLDSGLAKRTVRFERRVATLGTEQFRVAVVPIEGELTADNNQLDLEVNVTRNDIKILLADEFPRWEYRYLTQLFRRDSKVECDELLFHPRMIATGRREESKSVPITVDDWDYYDVIMMGDLSTDHLPVAAQESLVTYLRDRGGTLVMIAGTDSMPQAYKNMPLGEVVPVEPIGQNTGAQAGYEFRITAEGLQHPALMIGETEEENRVAWNLVNHYSPLPDLSAWRRPKAAARSLIAAVSRNSTDPVADEKDSSFLCWQQIGRGRIVYLSAAESFRLRFLRGDRLHYRFWGQLVRWAIASDLAAGSKFVRVRTDKSRYSTREPVHITVRLSDGDGKPVVENGVGAVLTGGNGETRTIALSADLNVPGEYRGEIRSLPAGEYHVEPVGTAVEQLQAAHSQDPATATLLVQNELPSELTETRCDRALAQQIAEITGGQVIPPTAIEEILKLTNLEPLTSEKTHQQPLWVQWKYLWIVFGCLLWEWIVRRRLGLS